MTQTEALKLALDALEELNNTNSYWWQEVDEQTIKKIEPTITAIKEALAQPEQAPVIGTKTWFEDGKVVTQHLTAKDIYKDPEQPEQEPVAFLTNHRQRMNVQIKPEAFVWMPTTTDWEVPLYTTPPQRTWVGLTDEEMSEIWENKGWYVTMFKAVEAKLKEKNT